MPKTNKPEMSEQQTDQETEDDDDLVDEVEPLTVQELESKIKRLKFYINKVQKRIDSRKKDLAKEILISESEKSLLDEGLDAYGLSEDSVQI